MRIISTLVLFLTFAQTSIAQTPIWVTITQESYTVAVVLPAGASYRFGDYANNKWSDPITVTAATTISPVRWPDGFTFADPDPGVAKELDILETPAPQTVTVTDSGVVVATLVPALCTTISPNAVWYQIAGGGGVTANLPDGTIYELDASTCPLTARGQVALPVPGSLSIMYTPVVQTIDVTQTGIVNHVVVPAQTSSVPAVVNAQIINLSFDVWNNSQLFHCAGTPLVCTATGSAPVPVLPGATPTL